MPNIRSLYDRCATGISRPLQRKPGTSRAAQRPVGPPLSRRPIATNRFIDQWWSTNPTNRLIGVSVWFDLQVLFEFETVLVLSVNRLIEEGCPHVQLSHLVFDGMGGFVQGPGDIKIG